MRESQFRPEIEGLRAVAAILVAIFHIYLQRVSGGVDVFFVVSGFLITTGLLAEADSRQRVDFLRFWGRLIKRLFPAAMLVLFAVCLASLLWMPQSRWRGTIEQIGAAATYTENWLLAANSVDYLARHRGTSPLQHFWALSVQGQFYLVWPFLIAGALKASARFGLAFRPVLRALLATLFGVSLAFSIYLTARHQPLAYLNTFARVWEFSMGALLAMELPTLLLPRWLRLAMGWLGLAGIVACGVVLQVSRVFPGYAALWPTLCAVFVIAAGSTDSPWGADRLLGSKPLVYLGSISYGIYLWHFPLLVFCRLYAEPHEIGGLTGAGVLAASVVLAVLTRRLVETPLREVKAGGAGWNQPYRVGAACVAPVAVVLACWSIGYLNLHHRHAAQLALQSGPEHPGALALNPGFRAGVTAPPGVRPASTAVEDDREILAGPACELPPEATLPQPCEVTGGRGAFTLAVVGGSHSSQWIPALKLIGERAGWRVVTFTKSNCPFYVGDGVGEKQLASCKAWNANVIGQLAALKPDLVFTTATRFDSEIKDEFVPEGYLRAWQALALKELRVVAVRDNPDFEFDVAACVEIHGMDAVQCALPRAQVLESPSPVALLPVRPANVRFIDLSDYFCDPSLCRPVVGNVLVYRHMNHLTATYVRTLTPMLERSLAGAIREFEPGAGLTASLGDVRERRQRPNL